MSFLILIIGLVVWFYVLRKALRYVFRHPEQVQLLFGAARHLLRK